MLVVMFMNGKQKYLSGVFLCTLVCVCVFSLFLQLQTTFQMPFMYELLCLKL